MKKWDLSVLFDASPRDAERLLIEVAEFVAEHNSTAAAAMTAVTDIAAWEKCRCGRTMTRREVVLGK